LLLVSLLGSCAQFTPKSVGDPISLDFAEGLIAELVETAAGNSSLQGLASFEMVNPDRSLSGKQVILVEKPDRLRAEVLNFFNSPLLLLAANGEHLNVFLPFENYYYSGAASAKNLGRFVRLPLRLDDLLSILFYQPLIIDAESAEAYALKAGGWKLVRHNRLFWQELFFDPERRLVEVNYYNKDGLSLSVDYGKFSGQDRLPRLFEIKVPRLETMVSLEFDELDVNLDIKPELFQIAIPADAKVFLLDQEL
jgi:hypothetical protein